MTLSSRFPHGYLRLLVLTLALLQASCVSNRPVERKDAPATAEPADLDRRARVRLELASAYFGRGQSSTALDEVKQALAVRPDLPEAHNLRGLIHASLNEPELAEESFRRALQLNGRDADTMHNYGWFLCQQRRFKDAEMQFQAAVAQPGYAGVSRSLMALGVCQARNNQWSEAERSLSRAYEFDPASPVIAVNLAEVLYRRGELERARFYIRRVTAQDPQVSAQTLWLALRIENKLGQTAQVDALGAQLRQRFPQSAEALLFDKGRFDE
jgi:type IV pilus assembly protein PilF